MRCALIAFALSLLSFAPARADIGAAQAAYDTGAYEQAIQAGESDASADGLTIASRALLAQALLAPSRIDISVLDRAVSDSERALALDPQSVDARLALAVAIGMKGRRVSLTEAWRRGYAQRGKRLIAEALALDPSNARAIALQGSWNLEVLRRAGSAGGMVLGARYDKGVAAFDRARAAAPDDPGIALHYAIALLALDPAKHGAQASDLLAAASRCKTSNAFDAALREEARRIGAVLATSGATAAAEMINRRYL